MTNLELIRINFGLSELHVVGQKWPFFGSFRAFSSLFGRISIYSTLFKLGQAKEIKMFRFNERQTLPNAFVTLENTLRTFSIRSEQTLNRPRRNITYDYTHQIFTVLFRSTATHSDSFISARLGIQAKADFLKDGVSIEFQPKSHFFA